MKEKAFDIAMTMNEKARETVLNTMESSFERTVGLQKKARKMKKNCATDLFAATKGNHNLHLEHEKGKAVTQASKSAKREGRDERKRKREEEEEAKKKRKQEKIAKNEEGIKRIRECTCQLQPCKFIFYPELVHAKMWVSCVCNRFYICPTHKAHVQSSLLVVKHQSECSKVVSNQ